MNWSGWSAAAPDRARRIRAVATGLLLAMAVLFAVARHFSGTNSAWGWLRAFSEAALVGGLADWFAVTALFRHPLGLPIPHTAIIPANKDRIADTMASFLRTHFLTPQVVSRRLRGMNLGAAVGAFLSDPQRRGEARLRQAAAGLLTDMLQSLDGNQSGGGQLGAMVKSAARHQLERLDIATLLGQLLGAAIADKRHLPLVDGALRWTGFALAENEVLLRGMIHEQAGGLMRWTGLDERLANALLDGTYRLLAECLVNREHPLRLQMETRLEKLAHDLIHDDAVRARVSVMRANLLANPAMAAWLDGLWHSARAALLRAARDPGHALSGQFGAGLATFGRTLQQDAGLQRLVNRFARRTMVGIAARHGTAIVTLVSETVKRWDTRTVTDRIEGAVGRDLQFIRLNGTLVGGTVGLVLYALDRLI